jgi:hypothetical protein
MTTPAWQRRIDDAQLETHTEIAGKEYERVRYGSEAAPLPYSHCPDCAVERGQLHIRNCDAEACPACGAQALGCDCGADTSDRKVH